jgi:hypothetical protein
MSLLLLCKKVHVSYLWLLKLEKVFTLLLSVLWCLVEGLFSGHTMRSETCGNDATSIFGAAEMLPESESAGSC